MDTSSALVDAINRLAEVISNSDNSYLPVIISTVLATVGSIVAVLTVDAVKNRLFKPTDEFERLRRRINSTLSMYANYYTNQIDIAHSSPESVARYSSAADEIRKIAVELHAFVDDNKRKKYKGVETEKIAKAADKLIGLSNSFFTPYNCPESRENRDNSKTAGEIRILLGIARKQ